MLESKKKAIIFFVLSLLLALTAGFLVLRKVQAINNNLGTMVKVFVAKNDISSRSLITPDNVETEEIPKKYLRDYHVTNAKELVNKVSVVPLSAGDMITDNILKQASDVVEENNRLISLRVGERVNFDEELQALDRVDIIVSERFTGKEETKLFMEDVKVARVAKEKGKFIGIQVEIPQSKVPELIHMQNYADSVRIVKSNVGISSGLRKKNQTETKQTIPPKNQSTKENNIQNQNSNKQQKDIPTKKVQEKKESVKQIESNKKKESSDENKKSNTDNEKK